MNVARFLLGVSKKASADMEVHRVIINGKPGVSIAQKGVVVRVLSIEFSGDKLQTICIVGNPDKLQHLQMDAGQS